MIKKIIFLFSLVVLCSSFAPTQDMIIGYWQITKVESSFEFAKRKRRVGNGFVLQFKEGGVVVSGRRVEKKKETRSGTYKFDPEKMTLEITDVGPRNDEPMKVLKLTKSKLVFQDPNSTVYFKKIKE